jgi:hypothetical protein
MKYLLLISIFFISCGQNKTEVVLPPSEADTAILESIRLKDSTIIVLDLADKKTTEVVKKVIEKVDDLEDLNTALEKENNSLKETIKVTKSTIIRDTVFITEKKNFWGKTKTMIDSSQSITEDSTQHKNL